MKIKNPTNPKEKMFWSLVIENQEQIAELKTIAEVYYLVVEAPDNFKVGAEFELFEGNKLVAKGIIKRNTM